MDLFFKHCVPSLKRVAQVTGMETEHKLPVSWDFCTRDWVNVALFDSSWGSMPLGCQINTPVKHQIKHRCFIKYLHLPEKSVVPGWVPASSFIIQGMVAQWVKVTAIGAQWAYSLGHLPLLPLPFVCQWTQCTWINWFSRGASELCSQAEVSKP